MAKLPGAENLSSPPSVAPNGFVARADWTHIADAMAQRAQGLKALAAGVANAGDAFSGIVADQQAQIEKAENLSAKSQELNLKREMDDDLAKRSAKADVGAVGFADSYIGDVDKRFKPFVENLPPRLQAEYGANLAQYRDKLLGEAKELESKETKRVSDNLVSDGEQKILDGIGSNPGRAGDNTPSLQADKEAAELHGNARDASPIRNDERARAFRERRAEAVYVARRRLYGEAEARKGLVDVVASNKRGYQPDIKNTSPQLINRFQKVQEEFGKTIPVVSGYRSPAKNRAVGGARHSQHMSGNAIDLDVSNLSKAERNRLIQIASANGITGIGVYANSMHFDLGGRRAWGPSHHSDSVPSWASTAIGAHLKGQSRAVASVTPAMMRDVAGRVPDLALKKDVTDAQIATALDKNPDFAAQIADEWKKFHPDVELGVAPEYADLPYEKRVKLYDQSERAEVQAVQNTQDATVREGIDLVRNDKLTDDWLTANQDNIPPTDYRRLSEALQRRERETDKISDAGDYTKLLSRAVGDGDQLMVQQDAMEALRQGRLSKADFNRVYDQSNRTRKLATEVPWAKEIRKSLSSRLQPLDREDSAQYAKRLDGLFAFDDWLSANPKATRDQAQKMAKEIGEEFSAATTADLRAGIDVPMFANVGRYAITRETLPMMAKKLADAYATGKVNKEQLVVQTELLKRWKTLTDEEGRINPK